MGGNKVLIHPYRDHRNREPHEIDPRRRRPVVRSRYDAPPQRPIHMIETLHTCYDYNSHSNFPRSRVNTGISNCDSGIGPRITPPLVKTKINQKLSTIHSNPNSTETSGPITEEDKSKTPPKIFENLRKDLESENLKREFANFSQGQRTMFYETYSLDKQKTIDTQQIEPLIERERFEDTVQYYMAYYKIISKNKRSWTNEIHKFANNNGFSFDFVVEKLTEHKKTELQI